MFKIIFKSSRLKHIKFGEIQARKCVIEEMFKYPVVSCTKTNVAVIIHVHKHTNVSFFLKGKGLTCMAEERIEEGSDNQTEISFP